MYTERKREGDPLLRNRRLRSPMNNSVDNESSTAGYQSIEPSADQATGETPPLLEIPEEIYAVRKAALQVLKPLNKTWVRSVAVSCALVLSPLT